MATSSTPLISKWHPDFLYDFILRIGEKDYSTDLVKVEIRSTINTPYQHIFLDVFMDPRDILGYNLFGQQPIKLTIKMIGKEISGYAPDLNFDLMFIDVEADYAPAEQSYITDQRERSVTRFKTVCLSSYQTMSTMVNEIYFNKKPYDIISDLVSKYTNAELKYDNDGRSSLGIDQFLIPPTTIYNVIKYLDKTYGIFEGPVAIHTSYDNKLMIQNLNKKPNKAQMFTLYLLATNKSYPNEALDPKQAAKTFYARDAVVNSYKGNAVFTVQAPSIKYIVHPRDELSRTIDINLETFSKNYGIIEKNNPKIYYNKDGIRSDFRIGIEKDQTGYDKDQTFIKANLSQNISDMAMTVANIDGGNLPVLNLMSVGEHVKINSQVDDHMKLSGSYILKGTDIQFIKATGWESFARLFMTRTNISQQ